MYYRDPFIGQPVTWIDSLFETEDGHIHRVYKTGIIEDSTDYFVFILLEAEYPMHLHKHYLAQRVEDFDLRQAINGSIGAYTRAKENDATPYSIYILVDPLSKLIRYVGISKQPQERLKQHLRGDGNEAKTEWIRELQKQNLTPEMYAIEEVNGGKQARLREAYWTHFFQDYPLTNWNNNEQNRDGGTRIDDSELAAHSLTKIARERVWEVNREEAR